jgi:hypothetical protein
MVCEQGTQALTDLWKSIPKDIRDNQDLKDHFVICAESAKAYYAQNQNEYPEIELLDKLVKLFDSVKEVLKEDESLNVQRIIDEKEVSAYDKTIKFLTSKQPQNG